MPIVMFWPSRSWNTFTSAIVRNASISSCQTPTLMTSPAFTTRRASRTCGMRGTELLHAIRASNRDNDCDTGREHVLLKSKILIDGEERFKTLGEHELQEIAIAL